MNYTLKQLQQRVNNLIEEQGEDAYCGAWIYTCLLYTSPSPRDRQKSRMPSSA